MKELNWEKHENNPFNDKTEVELSFELQDQRRKLQDHICDSWIAVIQYRVDLPIHHHPNEPLVMSVQSTCPI
jgi:hypothetical protein